MAKRAPLEPAEMRSKAAFRAMEKLLEHGAASEQQLWAVTRVMSGDELQAAAEERALAGLCGNPLCPHPQQELEQQRRAQHHAGLRGLVTQHRGSGEPESAGPHDTCCSSTCAIAVAGFAARLGTGGTALRRFETMLRELRRQDRARREQQQQQQPTAAAVSSDGTAAEAAVPAAPPSAAHPVVGQLSAAQLSNLSKMASSSSRNSQAASVAGKGSGTAATASGSSSSSRRATPASSSADGRAGSAALKGVLKKRSQFAAGNARTPIMLAEVQEREPSTAAADGGSEAPARRHSAASARGPAAVEGYVPRHRLQSMPHKTSGDSGEPAQGGDGEQAVQKQRKVRWSDEVDPEQHPEQRTGAGALPPAQVLPAPGGLASATAATTAPAAGMQPPPAPAATAVAALSEALQPAVFVLDVEDAQGPLEGGQHGLDTQFGRMRLAEPGEAAAAQHASATAQPAALAPSMSRTLSEPALPPRPSPNGAGMLELGRTASGTTLWSQAGRGFRYGGATVQEVRSDAPQWQPSPTGSSSNLLSAAVAEDDAAAAGGTSQRRQQAPHPPEAQQRQLQHLFPGLAASTDRAAAGGGGADARAAQHGPSSASEGDRTFGPRLPPQLEELLSSLGSSSEEEEGDEEQQDDEGSDWMESDEEGSEPEAHGPGGSSSGFRIRLTFFGMLFSHLEAWCTAGTQMLLASGPEEPLPPPPAAASPPVLVALTRFLDVALPPVAAALLLGAARADAERGLAELARTFRLTGPLPALKGPQWQVAVVVLLKALSLERVPSLREAFESRDGLCRLSQLLGSLSFTMDEFYAVLELLALPDSQLAQQA